ncbi:uncharacterized protein LOC100257280 isoform X2 [Vitis vinifera]|uniref:uncharacterized protein LOC100257280 isoform X2 n=1 Tax=Vitis vinifera TaxID=29760 RepID=UPI0028834E96|nr:uncharacterized protein LOC100257280 isoform X2 [Vitis vinifera]
MEKTEEMKEKQVAQMPSQRRIAPNLEVKLAAIAISLNVRLRSSDMPPAMQDHALRYSRSLVDAIPDATRPNPSHIARALKKVWFHRSLTRCTARRGTVWRERVSGRL